MTAYDRRPMRSVVVLVLIAVVVGALLTGAAGAAPGSQGLNSLTWLGTTATVAALIVAIGIYRVQRRDQDVAHQELLEAVRASDQLIADLAAQVQPQQPTQSATEDDALPADDDALTAAQRAKVEEVFGEGSIDAAWKTGTGRGNRPRLVRLKDGRLVSVYSGGRSGGTYLHEVEARRRDDD